MKKLFFASIFLAAIALSPQTASAFYLEKSASIFQGLEDSDIDGDLFVITYAKCLMIAEKITKADKQDKKILQLHLSTELFALIDSIEYLKTIVIEKKIAELENEKALVQSECDLGWIENDIDNLKKSIPLLEEILEKIKTLIVYTQ